MVSPSPMLIDLPPIAAYVCTQPPQQVGTEIERARDARLHGDYDGARQTLESLLQREPDNADAWLELGLTAMAAGENERARTAFERTLQLAPDYDDAKLGLARLGYREGDRNAVHLWLSRISSERQGDSEVVAMRALVAQARSVTWRVDAMVGYSSLTNGLSPWREALFAVSRRRHEHSESATIEYDERFGLSDFYGEIEFGRAMRLGTWALALGAAANADFRPEALVRLAYAGPEHGDWRLDATLSYARYGAGDVGNLKVGVARRLGDWRISAAGILVDDEAGRTRSGYSAAAGWEDDRGVDLNLVWTDAPESSEGVTIDTQSAAASLAFNISQRVRLRVGGLYEHRDAFDRSEISLAVTRVF